MGSLNLIIEKLSMSPPTWREYIFIAVISILVVQYWVLIQEKRASKLFLNILKGKSELTESKVKPEVNLSDSELDKITKTPIDREHLKLVFGFLNGFVEFDEFEKKTRKRYYYGLLDTRRLKKIDSLVEDATKQYQTKINENKLRELSSSREKAYRKIKIDEGDLVLDCFTGNTRFKYTFLFIEMISIDKRKSKNYLLFKKGMKSKKDLEKLTRSEKSKIINEYFEINRSFFNNTLKIIQNQEFNSLNEFYKWEQLINDLKRDLKLAILFVGLRIENGKSPDYFDIELMNYLFDEYEKL